MILPAVILFILSTAVYWALVIRTGLLSKRYFCQLGLLAVSAASGFWLAVLLLQPPSPIAAILGASLAILLALMSLVLFLVKLIVRPGDRPRTMHDLSRSFVQFTHPTRSLWLDTDDGVRIRVVELIPSKPREAAVIVCHGAGRSKDIHANVITCELLAERYAVFTFDWRGHQESGGFFTGDGASKYDLKRVIEYARQLGYTKIGVVAWSFGAWTAIVTGAEYKSFDSLVAAAPPPTILRDAAMARALFTWGLNWWAWPVRMFLKAIRNFRPREYSPDLSLHDVIADLAPIPLLLVHNTKDTAIGVPEKEFVTLFDKAGAPKERRLLEAEGHIYDWPNTFHYLNWVREWLEKTL